MNWLAIGQVFILLALISLTITVYRNARIYLKLFRTLGEAMDSQNRFNDTVIRTLRKMEEK